MTANRSTPDRPDLTAYRTVHTALRRAPYRMAAAARTIEPGDHRRVGAFARYWRGFAAEVLAHHTIEDDIMFPAIARIVPEFATHVERTDAEHHELDELMARCAAGVEQLGRDAGRPVRESLAEDLEALGRFMDGHLDFEDDEILPLIAGRITAEQYAALEDQATKAIGFSAQAAFAIPFIVDAADAATREHLLATAPFALRLLHRLTQRRHERLTARVLGAAALLVVAPEAVAS